MVDIAFFPIGKKLNHAVSEICFLWSAERRRNFFEKIREPQRIISERICSGVNNNWLCDSLDAWRERCGLRRRSEKRRVMSVILRKKAEM